MPKPTPTRVGRARLPTEEQWHRAAYGTPEGRERMYPWGDSARPPSMEIFIIGAGMPRPSMLIPRVPALSASKICWVRLGVDFHPVRTAAGVRSLLFYPGYSAAFFDGKHYVMKGGSPRTDAVMMRRSFRNWFQPHYPYVYGSFRCVEE